MGKGIDLARPGAPIHAAVLDDFKDQLILALVRRLTNDGADTLTIPVAEVDDTGGLLLAFKIENRAFVFSLRKKQ